MILRYCSSWIRYDKMKTKVQMIMEKGQPQIKNRCSPTCMGHRLNPDDTLENLGFPFDGISCVKQDFHWQPQLMTTPSQVHYLGHPRRAKVHTVEAPADPSSGAVVPSEGDIPCASGCIRILRYPEMLRLASTACPEGSSRGRVVTFFFIGYIRGKATPSFMVCRSKIFTIWSF